jgi:hypothetical protein
VPAPIIDETQMFNPEYAKAICSEPAAIPPAGIGFTPFVCTSSCFAPEVRVFFPEGYVEASEAHDKRLKSVVTLKPNSLLEDPHFRISPIKRWISSLRPVEDILLKFQMADGGSLRVTKNHPLVNSEGRVVEAITMKESDKLVAADGRFVEIEKISEERFFGKVYNLDVESNNPKGHIVVAEGYLSGSNYLQNDGLNYIGERLYRASLPSEVLN